MSILIKGMDMPTNCEKCPFLDYEEGYCLASGFKDKSGWYEFTLCPGGAKGGRPDDCPLVPVPPHGRLIDADALPWENQGFMLTDPDEWGLKVWDIEHAPTIIEAEEG